MKVFVVPYLCQKLELYRHFWDTTSETKAVIEDIKVNRTDPGAGSLDAQTFANYERNTKKWFQIIKNSISPGAKEFKKKIQELFPNEPDYIAARSMGLAQALLNNAKHGVTSTDPEMAAMIDPDSMVEALSKWKSLQDENLLNHIKIFEIVTT